MRNLLLFFIILLFLIGCKSTKSVERQRARYLSESKLIDHLIENQVNFTNIFVKRFDGIIEYDGNRFSFKGAMFIKDSSIIISIMPLMGIELFKVSITPTEIVVIDKTKKEVTYGDVDLLKKKINLDLGFKALQSVFTNRIDGFGCDNSVLSECLHSYKYNIEKDYYSLQNFPERKLTKFEKQLKLHRYFLEMRVNPENFRLEKLYIRDIVENSNVSIRYSDFTNYEGFIFPKSIVLEGISGEKRFLFSMELSQIEKDSKNELVFRVPDKYQKVYIK